MENEQIVIELKELLYMEFRRYLYRRKANVTAQSILLAIGYNINKLHHVYCRIKIPTIAEGNPESCMRIFPIIADTFGISLRPQQML